MESVIGLIVLAALLLPILLIALWARSANLKRRVQELEDLKESVRSLTTRIYGLERALERLRAAPPEPPLPVAEVPPSPPLPVAPTWRERFRGEEWEAVVGGSWLNKVGALILVIGIALFLAYSVTRLGPAGRVILALTVSIALIAGGVVLEPRPRYIIFARGLLGAGWAALYCTVYAMHALEAARVVRDPLAGALLLVAVAAGMIAHSLRYRSQAVTGLAYFAGFASLAITPVAAFSVAALVPLAASLLYVAYRFSWFSMALFGLIATYGTAAYKATGTATVFESQSILATYWLLFEAFEILRSAKRQPAAGPVAAIFPLNALAAILLSYLKWSAAAPAHLDVFFAGAAAAYLLTALVRAHVRPPSAIPADDWIERLLSGYEGAITLAAALAVPAICLGFSGLWITAVLAAEAEALFLAGLWLDQAYLRGLAEPVFFIPLVKLCFVDLTGGGKRVLAGVRLESWTPVALLLSALFYLNRWLKRTAQEYGYLASALVVLVLGFEVPTDYLGLAWFVWAALLFEFGIHAELPEFLVQADLAGLLGLATLAGINVFGIGGLPHNQWTPLAGATLVGYAAAARLYRLASPEHRVRQNLMLSAGTTFLAAMLWYLLPSPLIAVGWALMGLLLVELSLRLPIPAARMNGHVMMAFAFGRLFLANLTITGRTFGISHRMLTVVPFIVLCYYLRESLVRAGDRFARLYLYAPAIAAAFLLRFELGRTLAVVGWSLFGLALLYLGIRHDNRDLRWQSYALALFTFVRSWTTNFYIPESLLGMPERVVTGAIVIATFYAGEFLSPRAYGEVAGFWQSLDFRARVIFSCLATLLLTVLLYYEVSGSLLTVAWGLQGIALLVTGFPLRERSLRLAGLALFLFCILKLFLYDLRQLETLYRILSFVVLGLLLLGASWLYTRFREQLRQYL